MQPKCSQNAAKIQSKCSQNAVKIQSECSQNAAKKSKLSKFSQNSVTYRLKSFQFFFTSILYIFRNVRLFQTQNVKLGMRYFARTDWLMYVPKSQKLRIKTSPVLNARTLKLRVS